VIAAWSRWAMGTRYFMITHQRARKSKMVRRMMCIRYASKDAPAHGIAVRCRVPATQRPWSSSIL
jgi:hypothetical protein